MVGIAALLPELVLLLELDVLEHQIAQTRLFHAQQGR
jgi:hypothetical protein